MATAVPLEIEIWTPDEVAMCVPMPKFAHPLDRVFFLFEKTVHFNKIGFKKPNSIKFFGKNPCKEIPLGPPVPLPKLTFPEHKPSPLLTIAKKNGLTPGELTYIVANCKSKTPDPNADKITITGLDYQGQMVAVKITTEAWKDLLAAAEKFKVNSTAKHLHHPIQKTVEFTPKPLKEYLNKHGETISVDIESTKFPIIPVDHPLLQPDGKPKFVGCDPINPYSTKAQDKAKDNLYKKLLEQTKKLALEANVSLFTATQANTSANKSALQANFEQEHQMLKKKLIDEMQKAMMMPMDVFNKQYMGTFDYKDLYEELPKMKVPEIYKKYSTKIIYDEDGFPIKYPKNKKPSDF